MPEGAPTHLPLLAKIHARIGHRTPILCMLIGVVLALPSLGVGRVSDDWIHLAILRGAGPFPRSPNPVRDLFTFLSDHAQHTAAWKAAGLGSWWMDPHAKVALMRPIAALTHLFDATLWPNSLPLHHAHSLLWYGLAVLLASYWLNRVLGVGVTAALASLLFAVDDAHAMPAAWLANRNALIAFALAAACLLFHHRHQTVAKRRDLYLGMLFLSLALLASEAALGALAYILAWHVAVDERRLPKRLLALLPWLIPVTIWAVAYQTMGFGVRGSGVYLDPLGRPLTFLLALPERIPVLMLSLWSQLPVDGWAFVPRGAQWSMAIAGAVIATGMVAVFYPVLRATKEARLFGLGLLLSMVPLCGAFPMNRLLLFPSLGAAGLIAIAARHLTALIQKEGTQSRWRYRVMVALVALHLPLSALLLPLQCWAVPRVFGAFEKLEARLPSDPTLPTQDLIAVQSHDLLVAQLILIRACRGGVLPRKAAVLTSMMSKGTATRTAPNELVIQMPGGWLQHPFDRMFRDPDRRFLPGEVIRTPALSARVREINEEGMPKEVAFHFDRSLDDPSLRWITMRGDQVLDWVPPRIGESKPLDAEVADLWKPSATSQ